MILDKYALEIRDYKPGKLKDSEGRGKTEKSGDLTLPTTFRRFVFGTNPETWNWSTPSADAVVQTLGGKHVDAFGFGIQKLSITGSTGRKSRLVDYKFRFLNGYEQIMALYKIYEKSKRLRTGNEGRFETVFYNLKVGKAWYVNIDNFQMAMSVQRNHQYVYTLEMSILADYNKDLYKIFGVLGGFYSAIDEFNKKTQRFRDWADKIRGVIEVGNEFIFATDRIIRKTLEPVLRLSDALNETAKLIDNLTITHPLITIKEHINILLDRTLDAKRAVRSMSELDGIDVSSMSNFLKRGEGAIRLLKNNENITHKKNPPSLNLNAEQLVEIEAVLKGTEMEGGEFTLTPIQQQAVLIGLGYSIEKEIELEEGVSLERLAEELYGDPDLWKLIYETNKELIGDDPKNFTLGTKISVLTRPTQDLTVNALTEQLDVYDIWEKERIFGTSILFEGDDIVWDNNLNEWVLVDGLDNLIQTLKFRMETALGTFVRYSQYGNYALNQLGSTGGNEIQQVIAVETEKTLMSEPRIKDVRNIVILKKDDKLLIQAEVLPVFKEEYETFKQELNI